MTNTDALDLIDTLDRHRGFLLRTAEGLTETQARQRSTVSLLTIASILKHVADTEEQWMQFTLHGPSAFTQVYGEDTDWSAVAAAAAEDEHGDTEGQREQTDPRFVLAETDTLDALRERVLAVGRETARLLAAADLDATQPLPQAPWFEPGASWSVRRVALTLVAEISQHAGHADIIREAIDGQRTMG